MMVDLVLDVFEDRVPIRGADTESGVTVLPGKIGSVLTNSAR
jgi:hypothetical protein